MTTTKGAKTQKSKKEAILKTNLAKKNLQAITQELKYNYPDELKTPQQKKTFRRKARRTRESMESKLIRMDDKESKQYQKIQRELKRYLKEVLNH